MNTKRKKYAGTALMLAGFLLLASALLLVGYNVWDNYRAGRASQQALSELDGVIPELSGGLVPLYMLEPDIEMPTVEIDGKRYIGRLYIQSLGLTLPVIDEWSYPNLKIAPCRYSGSAYKDNLIIAAHNYDTHFGRLKTLESGDKITFTDVDGNIFYYTVAEVEQLQPTAIEKMQSGDWALTLFTCTIGGEYRVTVRCEKA